MLTNASFLSLVDASIASSDETARPSVGTVRPSTTRHDLLETLARQRLTRAEPPVPFADWVGVTYANAQIEAHRKDHGLYLTPPSVAGFMARMIGPRIGDVRLLDPAAGSGMLACAAIQELVGRSDRPTRIHVVAYEVDSALCRLLRIVLERTTAFAADRGVHVTTEVREEDFILANARALDRPTEPERFDVVIANPPYFKIGKDDPRAVAANAVVHGQPNIYGLFMAVGAALLEQGGDFVYITPRSFASGPYFKRFREWFFATMRPVEVHVFGSRRDAFSRDDVLQENVILHATRDRGWRERAASCEVAISNSAGLRDLDSRFAWRSDLSEVLNGRDPGSVLRLPSTPDDERILQLVDRWTGSLHDYGLAISTGPVVPFRATRWLADRPNETTVPLIWMNHVRAMELHWPNGVRKPQHFISDVDSRRLLLPSRNYVVLRRFSAKEERRRLTAAPLLAGALPGVLVGLENHLNYLHRPGGTLTTDEAWGLAALFNSALFDAYFRCINGNTQVGATELRMMPLPPLEQIAELGRVLKEGEEPISRIDHLVLEMASCGGALLGHRDGREVVD